MTKESERKLSEKEVERLKRSEFREVLAKNKELSEECQERMRRLSVELNEIGTFCTGEARFDQYFNIYYIRECVFKAEEKKLEKLKEQFKDSEEKISIINEFEELVEWQSQLSGALPNIKKIVVETFEEEERHVTFLSLSGKRLSHTLGREKLKERVQLVEKSVLEAKLSLSREERKKIEKIKLQTLFGKTDETYFLDGLIDRLISKSESRQKKFESMYRNEINYLFDRASEDLKNIFKKHKKEASEWI